MHWEFWRDLAASSAVNFPIRSASFRLVVVWMGVGSTRCTYSGARAPPRFTLTINLMFFILISLAKKFWGDVSKATVHFFEIEYTTAVKGLPHSMQLALNRDVINPHDGHILCGPNPAACGLSLRILRISRIVNSTINRPKAILAAFITATLLGEFRVSRVEAFRCRTVQTFGLAEKPKVEELHMDWLRSEDLKEEKELNRLYSHYSSGVPCGSLSLPSGVDDGSMSDRAILVRRDKPA